MDGKPPARGDESRPPSTRAPRRGRRQRQARVERESLQGLLFTSVGTAGFDASGAKRRWPAQPVKRSEAAQAAAAQPATPWTPCSRRGDGVTTSC